MVHACRSTGREVEPKYCMGVFYQLLLGLRYIHQQGMIHRDLKPSNIFILRTGSNSAAATVSAKASAPGDLVRIGDFGLTIDRSNREPTSSKSFGVCPCRSCRYSYDRLTRWSSLSHTGYGSIG